MQGDDVVPNMWLVYSYSSFLPLWSHKKRRYERSEGATLTCINICSMSADFAIWLSLKRKIIPTRLLSKSGPFNRFELRHWPWKMLDVLVTRRIFRAFFRLRPDDEVDKKLILCCRYKDQFLQHIRFASPFAKSLHIFLNTGFVESFAFSCFNCLSESHLLFGNFAFSFHKRPTL